MGMKKVTKANGLVTFVNVDYIDEIVEEGDVVEDIVKDENQVIDAGFSEQEMADYNQRMTNQESLKYLADTDWYVIRKQEKGTPIPEDILQKREESRSLIRDID